MVLFPLPRVNDRSRTDAGFANGQFLLMRRTAYDAIGGHAAETVTLSIGVAAAAPDQGTRDYKVVADRLIAEADAALYRAKSAGRNRIAASRNIVR